MLEREGILSILLVPTRSKEGRLLGFIGFDAAGRKREWSDDDVRLLKVASDMVSSYFERRKADETIRQMAYYDPLTGLPNRRQWPGRGAGPGDLRVSINISPIQFRRKDFADTVARTI